MNTDASNVEDINIHHIRERLWMSCTASSEEGFNIFRTRSFNLCKNDRDLRERFDSCGGVRVHIIIDDKLVIYGSHGSCSQHFTRFLLLRRPLVVNVPFWVVWWASAQYGSPRTCLLHILRAQRYVLTSRFGLPRAFRCSRGKHVRIPHAASRDQIHHRLWFCCDSFFTCIFLRSFRHRFEIIDGTEMADVEQTQKIPFHSSRVKFPFVSMSASWFLVSMYLICGVQIDSIEQPIKSNSVGSGYMSHCRASSLYDHLDHCFVVFKHIQQSFLTRRIHLWGNEINIVQIIDHSLRLFSFLNCLRCWTNLSLVRTQVSPCLITLICEKLRRSDSINQVRVYHPTSILHPRKWFLILNCAKLKFVFYTSNWLEQMYDFQKSTMFHLM